MKTLLLTTIAAAILALGSGIPTVLAGSPISVQEQDDPVGECPPPFEMHHAADHDHEHSGAHRHIGTDTDKNQDGRICVNPSGKDDKNHVHIDNVLPL